MPGKGAAGKNEGEATEHSQRTNLTPRPVFVPASSPSLIFYQKKKIFPPRTMPGPAKERNA